MSRKEWLVVSEEKKTTREVLGLVDLKVDGEVYEDVEVGKVIPGNGRKEYYTTGPHEALKFPPNKIRLYLRKGMGDDFEEVIRPLFEGDVVHFSDLPRKKGGTYDADFVFYPSAIPPYLDDQENPYFYGTLEFAPRDDEFSWG